MHERTARIQNASGTILMVVDWWWHKNNMLENLCMTKSTETIMTHGLNC